MTSPNDFHGEQDYRRLMPRFSVENYDKNFVLIKELRRIAGEKGVTSGQLVLAWLMTQGDDILPIPVYVLSSFESRNRTFICC